MPTLRMSNKKKGARAQQKSSKGRRASRPSQSKASNEILSLARLLADPCEASLVAPQYGASDGGYLSKFSTYHSVEASSTRTSGYLIWYPDYSGNVTSPTGNGSLFLFGTDDAGNRPLNTIALPLGMDLSTTTGTFLVDPARVFEAGDMVQDARTIAGCLKMMYTGRNDALAGRIGFLENVPRDALLNGGGSGLSPSVQQLFKYSNKSMRTPLDSVEVKFRPSEGSSSYRTTTNVDSDFCFKMGTKNVTDTVLPEGAPSGDCHGIGFIWDGLTDGSSLTFDLLKAIEWRPDMQSGLTAPCASTAAQGGNMVSRSITYLDRQHPGWQTRAFSAAKSLGASVANMAYEGAKNEVVRSAAPLLLTMI